LSLNYLPKWWPRERLKPVVEPPQGPQGVPQQQAESLADFDVFCMAAVLAVALAFPVLLL
jgi:hypothetical protein